MSKSTVVDKLTERFGMGDKQEATIRLYRRISQIVQKHGDPATEIVNNCAANAEFARNRGVYFRMTVRLALMDAGFWHDRPGQYAPQDLLKFARDGSEGMAADSQF